MKVTYFQNAHHGRTVTHKRKWHERHLNSPDLKDLSEDLRFHLVAMSRNAQFIAQSFKTQYRKRIFNQLHVYVSAELLEVNPLRLSWKGRRHSRFGSPSCFWCVVWFSFPAEKDKFHHHRQISTTVNNVQPLLRLHHRFSLGCVRFFDRRVAFEEVCFVHVCKILVSGSLIYDDGVLVRKTLGGKRSKGRLCLCKQDLCRLYQMRERRTITRKYKTASVIGIKRANDSKPEGDPIRIVNYAALQRPRERHVKTDF